MGEHVTKRAGLMLVLLAAMSGCEEPADPTVIAKPASIETLAQQIEESAGVGTAELAAHFDWDAFARRTAPPGLHGPERDAFLRGVRESLGTDGAGMLSAMSGGAYSYRGLAWRDGLPVARFRFLPTTGGFNFQDLVIARRPDGSLRVVDVFVMTTSEYLTQSMQRIATFMLGDTSDLAGRMFGDQGVSSDEIESIREFNSLSSTADPETVLRAYDELTPRVQRQRTLRLMRVQVAAQLEDQSRYLQILNETAVNLPNDPALASMMLDAHYLSQDWAGCLSDLASLRRTYQDPYIDAFEGRVQVAAGAPDLAMALADSVIAAENALIDGHDVALLAALALNDHARARLELAHLETYHGVDRNLLATLPGYEGLATLPTADSSAPADD